MRINEYFLTFLKVKIISYTVLYRHDDILISYVLLIGLKVKKEFIPKPQIYSLVEQKI